MSPVVCWTLFVVYARAAAAAAAAAVSAAQSSGHREVGIAPWRARRGPRGQVLYAWHKDIFAVSANAKDDSRVIWGVAAPQLVTMFLQSMQASPSPGADVAGASPVLAQMWRGRARSWRRCGGGEPSRGADVAGRGEPSRGADVAGLGEPI